MTPTSVADRFGHLLDSTPPLPRTIDDPRREMLLGGALVAALLAGVGIWAANTRLDAAVISPGVVQVSGARQIIQTPSGGVVSAVRVANGDLVHAGQILIEFTDTEALAQERSLAARAFALQAEIARINAEFAGQTRVPTPATFTGLSPADAVMAGQALAMQQSQLDAQRALESSQAAIIHDRGAQITHEIEGNQQRLASTRQQSDFNKEELASYEDLYAKGLATKPRVLALRSKAASIDGDAGQTIAQIASLRTQVGEARLQFVQMKSERSARNAERMQAAQTELSTVLPQWQAAADQLRRTVIRAPFTGTVTALRTPTPGAVLTAGAALLEIVPTRGAVTIESRVSLADANDLHPGQTAEVRLSSLRGRLLPSLDGKVERVSADSVEDEKTGQAFYTATISVSATELKRVSRLGEVADSVRVGTPVQVVVATKPRSALDFLISPLVARTTGAFSQR